MDVAGAALAHTVETLQDPGLRTEYEESQTKKLTQRAQAVAHEFVYTEVRASRPLSFVRRVVSLSTLSEYAGAVHAYDLY
jgi:hypothetical protein